MFGISVSLYGDTALIGAGSGDDDNFYVNQLLDPCTLCVQGTISLKYAHENGCPGSAKYAHHLLPRRKPSNKRKKEEESSIFSPNFFAILFFLTPSVFLPIVQFFFFKIFFFKKSILFPCFPSDIDFRLTIDGASVNAY